MYPTRTHSNARTYTYEYVRCEMLNVENVHLLICLHHKFHSIDSLYVLCIPFQNYVDQFDSPFAFVWFMEYVLCADHCFTILIWIQFLM